MLQQLTLALTALLASPETDASVRVDGNATPETLASISYALDRATEVLDASLTSLGAAARLIDELSRSSGEPWRFTYQDGTVVTLDFTPHATLTDALETIAGQRGSACDAQLFTRGDIGSGEPVCLDWGTARELILLHGRINQIQGGGQIVPNGPPEESIDEIPCPHGPTRGLDEPFDKNPCLHGRTSDRFERKDSSFPHCGLPTRIGTSDVRGVFSSTAAAAPTDDDATCPIPCPYGRNRDCVECKESAFPHLDMPTRVCADDATCRERVFEECVDAGFVRDYCADVAHDVCDPPTSN